MRKWLHGEVYGKLIICLSDEDLKAMLQIKKEGEKTTGGYLEDILDDMLMRLENRKFCEKSLKNPHFEGRVLEDNPLPSNFFIFEINLLL